MRFHATGGVLLALVIALTSLAPAPAAAQEDGDENQMRVITVTTFQVPFYERGKVFPFMRKYFMPGSQLNPNVTSYRVLWHNWGGDASEVIVMAEYDDITKIEAPCGQPCDDYFEAHPQPEEGDEGWEEFRAGQEAFQKYYAHHKDEIYLSPLAASKIEGEMRGPVGMPEEEDEGM